MGIIAWIIIGLIAGWLATQILGGRGGLFAQSRRRPGRRHRRRLALRKLNIAVEPGFVGQPDHRHHRRRRLSADLARDPACLQASALRRGGGSRK